MDKKLTQMFKENSNELITRIGDVGKKRKCFTLMDFLGQFEKYNSLISQLTMKLI